MYRRGNDSSIKGAFISISPTFSKSIRYVVRLEQRQIILYHTTISDIIHNHIPEDPLEILRLFAWLEDTHIRRLPIPDRKQLHQTPFVSSLRQYLRLVSTSVSNIFSKPPPLPTNNENLKPSLSWLIDLSLHLLYTDNSILFNQPIDPWHGLCIPIPDQGTEIQSDVMESTQNLLNTLNINHNVQLATSADDALNVANDVIEHMILHKNVKDVDVEIPELDDLPLGFDSGDQIVNRAAKVMRCLHVRQLRQLQDEINGVVSEMQAITSNPKTNSKLGQVGR